METRGPGWLDEQVSALSRAADRDSLFMHATFAPQDGRPPFVVRVRNLSAGGMLAETAALLAQGALVDIDLRNIGPVSGRVVWVGQGKAGIAFDRPVDPYAVRRQIVRKSDVPLHLRRAGLEGRPFRRPC